MTKTCKLKIGIIGFGFMGKMHFQNWCRIDGAEVIAICSKSLDPNNRIIEVDGNIEGEHKTIDLTGVQLFSDFTEMVNTCELDAVSITLPTNLHKSFTIKALNAGLHVLCEKPMALNTNACNEMIDVANKSGKTLLIGHCIRFWPEYAKAKEIIDSKEYGDIVSANFKRLGAAPSWSGSDWFKSDALSGSIALDLHIHDTDYIQYVFGKPNSVTAVGSKGNGTYLKHIMTTYQYDNGAVITAEGSWAMAPTFEFQMSFEIALESATITYDNTRAKTFMVYPHNGSKETEPFTPPCAEGDGYQREIEYFKALICDNTTNKVCTVAQSKMSVEIIEAELTSLKFNKHEPIT